MSDRTPDDPHGAGPAQDTSEHHEGRVSAAVHEMEREVESLHPRWGPASYFRVALVIFALVIGYFLVERLMTGGN